MKLIVCEGGDRLGKSTLIEGLCKHFNYDNVCVRHFGKPPKNLSPIESDHFQFTCFHNEANLVYDMQFVFSRYKYHYYDDVVIWNRSHLGEYVYGQMFRNGDAKQIKEKLIYFEKFYMNKIDNVYLITLTADPEFFLSKEDGSSFSNNLEQKTKELELFKEAHKFSSIKKKLIVKVDKNKEFKLKEDIFQETLNFLNL